MRLPNGYGGVHKLPGKRRKPYAARKTVGWDDKGKQLYKLIGTYKTKPEALKALADFNEAPYDLSNKFTFAEIYEKWKVKKFEEVSDSSIKAYTTSFKSLAVLHDKVLQDLKLIDLQNAIDKQNKNYPMRKKMKILIGQLYAYAMKHDIVSKDYSKFIELGNQNDKKERKPFTNSEINKLFDNQKNNDYIDIILMLIYNGARISEFLDLKKENVNIEEQYFDITDSKTYSGVRRVPIATKMVPLYKKWMERNECEYLVSTPEAEHFLYRNYYDSYWKPLIEELKMEHTPHDTRHTTITKLATAKVDQTRIKLIVGHSGAMSLSERVYTHLDIKELIDAVDLIT